jgi:hypothetical protein
MRKITLEGPPFDLGLAQHTRADRLNGAVELTVYVMIEGQPQPVQVRMTGKLAQDTATELAKAARTRSIRR